jgi:TonB-linked SusC/RagA family outer membrane protein
LVARSHRANALLALAGALLLLPATLQAQGRVIGTVTEQGSMRPLDAVQVFIPGTSIGALTNSAGRFVLLNVPAGETVVQTQRVGYANASETVTVVDGETVTVEFTLRTSAIELDQIVVTGAGQATAVKKLGNTIATVNMDVLEDAPINNFSELLQGREPGVNLSATGGMAGEGSQIRIRGTSSLTQDNNPIIYVDGIRIDNSVNEGDAGGASRLDDINPDAIERVEILKGAAAATLYGTEASNGVIQIFTKQGRAGQTQWEFSTEGGFAAMDMSRYQPHAGFACSRAGNALVGDLNGDNVGDGCSQVHADQLGSFWGVGSLSPYQVFEAPLLDELFETGNHQSYSLSVRGGSESMNYFVSGRYAREDGAFGGADFGPARDLDTQKQATANVNFFPADNFRFRITSMYTERYHEVPTNGNNTTGTFSMAIMSKPELASVNNPTGTGAFATMREMFNIEQFEETRRFAGSVNASYNPIDNLTLDGTFGVDIISSGETDFRRFGWDVDDFSSYAPQGDRGLTDHNRREVTIDLKATYNTMLGDRISSDLLVGTQILQSEYHRNYSYGFSFPAPGLEVTGAAAEPTAGETLIAEVNAGVFAQGQFGWDDYLFATLGARFDQHSAFGTSAGAQFYPKVSLSFVPSDMDGWNGMGPISSLRVRGAIGQSGLQPGAFDQFTTFSPRPSEDGPGVQPANLGNPDLRPEISTEWEVGADFGVLDDRLSFDLTYWDRTVNDVLVPRQFPPSGGFTTPQLFNLGEMRGKGIEIGVNGLLVNTPNFSLDMFANASYLNEEVTDMGGAPAIKVGYYRYRTWIAEGYAPGAFFTRNLANTPYPFDQNGDGVADTEAQMLAFLSTPKNPDQLVMLAGEAGEGPAGEHYRGKPTPDWSGSFGGSMSIFGNFRLRTQFDYAFGNFYRQNLSGSFRASHWLLGRNTPETAQIEATLLNPASTAQERLAAAQAWTNEVSLSPWSGLNAIEEADYIRFREISLSYSVPGDAIEGLGLNRMTLSVAARNLKIWTKYSGIDPDNNVTTGRSSDPTQNFVYGIDGWRPGVPRRLTFGVRVGF